MQSPNSCFCWLVYWHNHNWTSTNCIIFVFIDFDTSFFCYILFLYSCFLSCSWEAEHWVVIKNLQDKYNLVVDQFCTSCPQNLISLFPYLFLFPSWSFFNHHICFKRYSLKGVITCTHAYFVYGSVTGRETRMYFRAYYLINRNF